MPGTRYLLHLPLKLLVLFRERGGDPHQGQRGLSLLRAGQELCNHSFSTKPEHWSCWKLWCGAQAKPCPGLSFICKMTRCALKSLDSTLGGWKRSCMGDEGSLNDVVTIWSHCLWCFPFPLPFHFYSYVCSAPWRKVSRFFRWLCISSIRISAEWVNLILKLNI